MVFLVQLLEVDIHRERVTHLKETFHEFRQGDIHFPMKIKDIPTFERLKNLNKDFLELSSVD